MPDFKSESRKSVTLCKVLQMVFVLLGVSILIGAMVCSVYSIRLESVKIKKVRGQEYSETLSYTGELNLWKHKMENAKVSATPAGILNATELSAAKENLTATVNNFFTANKDCPDTYPTRLNGIAVLLVLSLIASILGVVVSVFIFLPWVEQRSPEHMGTGIIGVAFICSMVAWSLMIGTFTTKCLEERLSNTVVQTDSKTNITETSSASYGHMLVLTILASASFLVASICTAVNATKRQREQEEDGGAYRSY